MNRYQPSVRRIGMCSAASIGQASSVSLLDRSAHDDNKRPAGRVQKRALFG
jgi:hypothetical protein